MNTRRFHCITFAALATLIEIDGAIALPAFPGAEGFGGSVTGGRGGDVYHVTSLADTNTIGTLRYGINNAPAGGRTIVFDTSGMITLGSNLNIGKSNLTLAGQTAPGQGVTIRGWETAVQGPSATPVNNVIVRYLRFRAGDMFGPANQAAPNFQGDSVHIRYAKNVIFDHLSASWSIDETMSASSCDNVTIQRSIVGEALRNAGHDNDSGGTENHSFGMLLGSTDANYLGRLSIHHNVFTSNDSRNPRIGNDNQLDFVNNVLHNWGGRVGYSGGAAEGTPKMNYVGNYLIAGPSTTSGHVAEAFYGGSTNTQIYQSGNLIDPDKDAIRDGTNTGTTMFTIAGGTQTFVTDRFAYPQIITDSAATNYTKVLSDAGVWIYRDSADTRMINNIINGTGAIIDSQDQVGGYPTLVNESRAAGFDSDNDGIPNTWEAAVGTNPNVANHNADFDSDGYTDLEEYLNDIGAFPATSAITWTGGTGRYALSSNFTLNWQPSRFDTVRISSGTATVDAPGQNAGTLSAINGTLAVTSGWIDIATKLQIGSGNGPGTVTQSGGTVIAKGTGIQLNDVAGLAQFAINYNLNGGTLAATAITAPGTGTNFNFNGGTLTPLASTTSFMSAGINAKVQAGGAKIDTAGFNVTVAAPLIHDSALGATVDGGLIKSGAGTLSLNGANTFTGPASVLGGKLLLAQGLRNTNNLIVAENAIVEVAANGGAAGVSRVKSVQLSKTGNTYTSKLELHNNDLVIDYTGLNTSPYATIVAMVKQGLTSLGGNGQGITSAEVNAQSLPGTTLAVVDANTSVTTLSGFTIPNPAASVLVKYTWRGDANLDGLVDGTDYALTDSGFASAGNRWNTGDFNYDNTVDGTDYALIDSGFSSQAGSLPEPGMIGVIGLLGTLASRRVRRGQ